jgi:coniferyl-aldehyde dehydrogenase
MGAYHGRDGFLEFSCRRAVYTQMKRDISPLVALRPPYGAAIRKTLASQIKR